MQQQRICPMCQFALKKSLYRGHLEKRAFAYQISSNIVLGDVVPSQMIACEEKGFIETGQVRQQWSLKCAQWLGDVDLLRMHELTPSSAQSAAVDLVGVHQITNGVLYNRGTWHQLGQFLAQGLRRMWHRQAGRRDALNGNVTQEK